MIRSFLYTQRSLCDASVPESGPSPPTGCGRVLTYEAPRAAALAFAVATQASSLGSSSG